MSKTFRYTLALWVLVAALPALAQAADEGVIEIPYTKYILDNGLTLIVHEDHKAPVVAVNVWYDVGAGDEKPGKTGFAHLFEHLMFNGSENFDDDYFKAVEKVGVTGINGTTNSDRTNYFQVVPKTALDTVLWLESDRMGHMLGAVTQEKLDEQRGVVQNEKRQGESRPYGKVFLTIYENTYPDGHPYDHSTIGSMEDLNAASLEDVHEWFKTYYGPSNAVIAIAGDIEAEDVKARVEKYFGHIPPGPPLIKPAYAPAPRTTDSRHMMQDRVPQARIVKVWNVPGFGDADVEYLDMATDVLASGKSSRLYKRLVYEDQIATDVVAFNLTRQFGGMFIVWATAQPGGDLAEVERILDEEIERFIAEGPTDEEVERSRVGQRASFVRGVERIGGFGGKSDVLALSQVYGGSPDAHEEWQRRFQSATAADIHAASQRWMTGGVFSIEVHPYPRYAATEGDVDRSSGPPEVTDFPAGVFPARQKATLSNGLNVILAQRDAVPVVNFNMLMNAGFASDQFGLPGTAALALIMLDEGTASRTALEISDEQERLGANLGVGSNLDMSNVSLSALKENLDKSLDLFADVVLNPSFPEAEFTRLRQLQLASIQREKVQPNTMGLRVLPRLLYGEDHAYGNPLTGSGTEESVAAISIDSLRLFHDTWFRPNNATLIVVGDIGLDELLPKLEARFGDWKKGDVPTKNLADVEHQPESVVYIVDRPDSEQSTIYAGHIAPPKSDSEDLKIDAINEIIGGGFTARINMNLREDKNWTYGARTVLADTAAQRPFFFRAPVQTDKTAESMAEILKEVVGIRSGGDMPATEDELTRVKNDNTLTLPGRWETNGAVMADIVEMVRFGLSEDHWDTFADQVRGLDLAGVSAQADRLMQPDHMVWVVVGDRAGIEEGIAALEIGEILYLDADGNPVDD